MIIVLVPILYILSDYDYEYELINSLNWITAKYNAITWILIYIENIFQITFGYATFHEVVDKLSRIKDKPI